MSFFPVHIGPYTISLGYCGPTDACLCLNDKEYLIESPAWILLEYVLYHWSQHHGASRELLKIIYNEMDDDLREPNSNQHLIAAADG